jgi:RimJ/RimL family protein N-acetyltransferase
LSRPYNIYAPQDSEIGCGKPVHVSAIDLLMGFEPLDVQTIRRILNQDRAWSIFALGDLDPEFFARTQWVGSASGLIMIYRGFDPPILFAIGAPQDIEPLLRELRDLPSVYLNIRTELLPLVHERFTLEDPRRMFRMILDPSAFNSGDFEGVVRLGSTHLPQIRALYRSETEPEFFREETVAKGVFYGVFEQANDQRSLISVAGTHLVCRSEGVAALGNVHTRKEYRNRGLAKKVTAAVVAELCRLGVTCVGLNVAEENAAAKRAYEQLGFKAQFPYIEGVALRQ